MGARVADSECRPLTEEERARVLAARDRGGLCCLCGRMLAPDEAVWLRRIVADLGYSVSRKPARRGSRDTPVYWQVPVGRECVAADVLRALDGEAPDRCITCGRGVYCPPDGRRRVVACSSRCRRRHHGARYEQGKARD